MNRKQEEITCARKICYRESVAKKIEINSKYLLRPYKCSVCFGWHMTSMATQRLVKMY